MRTCDCAARLYTSSGHTCSIIPLSPVRSSGVDDRFGRSRSSRSGAQSHAPRNPFSAETPRDRNRPARSRRLSMLLSPSVAGHQPMRIAVKMLGGKFQQLGVFDRFHLMNQSDRYIHAFAGDHLELLDGLALGRFLDADFQFSAAQIKRFGFQLMVMQRAFLALADLQDFSAVQVPVGDPDLASPPFGYNSDRFSCPIHRFSDTPPNEIKYRTSLTCGT